MNGRKGRRKGGRRRGSVRGSRGGGRGTMENKRGSSCDDRSNNNDDNESVGGEGNDVVSNLFSNSEKLLLANTRVQMDGSDDPIDDLREVMTEAIPGILDNSISETIEIISKLDRWALAILDGRNEKGQLLLEETEIEKHTKSLADHKNSSRYLATQLKFINRIQPVLKQRKAKYVQQPNAENQNSSHESILLNLIEATVRGRSAKEETMKGVYEDKDLVLNKLVPEDDK